MKTKKTSKGDVREKLQNKAEKLWKEYCLKRDGRECQVKKYFPNIAINHTEVFQVDHCFSRMIKELFLDIANGTVICSSCNQAKGSGKISSSKKDAITVAVHEIVKMREGEATYQRLFEIGSRSTQAFLDWKNIAWLEQQISILQSLTQEKG